MVEEVRWRRNTSRGVARYEKNRNKGVKAVSSYGRHDKELVLHVRTHRKPE